MPRFVPVVLVLVGVTLLGAARTVAGQAHPATTERAPLIESVLEQATAAERRGEHADAVRLYLEAEAALEQLRRERPEARPVTEVGPGLDRSIALVIADRVSELPPQAQARYRLTSDPRARRALSDALASGLPEAIEGVVARFPLAPAVDQALATGAERAFERGELGRAIRLCRWLERRAPDAGARRRFALLRTYAATIRGDAREARAALSSFAASGGAPERPRAFGHRTVPPTTLVAEVADGRPGSLGPAVFDLGARVDAVDLAHPEVGAELAARLEQPATPLAPVLTSDGATLIVADGRSVRAVPLRAGAPDWAFTFEDEAAEPTRVEVASYQPALGPGRVFATVHRNRPARLADAAPGDGAGDAPPQVVRQRDWRLVALDLHRGERLWDAAGSGSFEQIARDAEWVSSPLFAEGALYVVVLERPNELRASLVRLDAGSGEVTRKTFLAARDGYDFLGLGAPAVAPRATADGLIVAATGLGVIAAVEPATGEVAWISRYPAAPASSEPTLIETRRRFRAAPPLIGPGPLVVAPVDAAEVLALDPATGRVVWRHPRGDARLCVSGPAGEVLLLGDRLTILERESGKVRLRGPELPQPVIAPPAVLAAEVVAATGGGLVRIALEDGRPAGRLRFDDPAREVGACLVAGQGPDAQLLTLGRDRVNRYATLEAQRQAIARRFGAGPRADLRLGELFARRGELNMAIRHLRRAATAKRLDATTRLEARLAGVVLLRDEALERLAARDAPGFRSAVEYALGFLGAAGGSPSGSTSAAERELLLAAAPLLAPYGAALTESEVPDDGPRAARILHRLLWVPPGTLVPGPGGVEVDAAAYGWSLLRELVDRRGPGALAELDAIARESYQAALTAGSAPALAAVAEQFPVSSVGADARLEQARLLEADELRADAAAALERFLLDHPGEPRGPEVSARLAGLYEQLQRPASARRALAALVDAGPEVRVRPGPGRAPAQAAPWARGLLERLRGGLPPAVLADQDAVADLDPPLARRFRGATELSQAGAELLAVPGWEQAARDVVFVRRGASLEVTEVDDGRVRARLVGLPAANPRRAPFLAGRRLVVPGPDRIAAYAIHGAQAGERLWERTIASGPAGLALGPEPVHMAAGDADLIVVLTGHNEAVALEPASGAERWRRRLASKASGGVEVRGPLVTALSREGAHLMALRARDGELAWEYRPPSLTGVAERLDKPTWLRTGLLALDHGGKHALALDAVTGRELWRSPSVGEAWILELQAAGEALVSRLQTRTGFELRVFDAATGQVAWRDEGAGPIRPGGDVPEGPRSALDRVLVGDGVVYTFRTRVGRSELVSQGLGHGERRWSWTLPIGSRAFTVIDTPTAVLVPRSGVIGAHAQLTVLARGDGATKQTLPIPGRRVTGGGAMARGGVVVVTSERGVVGFGPWDPTARAREVVALAGALAADPRAGATRDRLAARLDEQDRGQEAMALLEDGMLAEGVGGPEFDTLFARAGAVAESLTDAAPSALRIRGLPRPPAIDGELNDWWRPWSSVALRGPRFVQQIQQEPGSAPGRWRGREDLSARLYLGWDAKNLYFALDVEDTNLRPYDSDAERWIGDCLLIAIDCRNDGGQTVMGDDVLLSLALTLPRKKDDEAQEEQEKEDSKPEGKYFVRRKEDGSGAVYEAAVPWAMLAKNGALIDVEAGPEAGLEFGFNIVLTDDDGDRFGPDDPNEQEGPRGALKTLELTPSVLLHYEKSRLWRGYIPARFAKVRLE